MTTKKQARMNPAQFKRMLKRWAFLVLFIGCIIALLCNHGKYSAPGLYGHLAIPGRFLIANFARFIGGYGMGIIMLTVIVRLCLMPSMIKTSRSGTINSYVQKFYSPKIKKLKSAVKKAKHNHQRSAKKKYEHQLTALYRDHHLGLSGMGCGTIIIQWPIFGALYASIRYSPEIQHSSLLGISLGRPSMKVASVCFLLYLIDSFINYYCNLRKRDLSKYKHKQLMHGIHMTIIFYAFAMPFWIGTVAMKVSAGLALYFCVGGCFVIGQQLYLNHARPKYEADGKKLYKHYQRLDKSKAK